MNGIEWHFLIPSRQSLNRGEDLNLLIGADNKTDTDISCPVRIYCSTDGDPFLLAVEERILPAGQPTHIYITLSGKALEEIDDDEFIISLEGGLFPQMICYND